MFCLRKGSERLANKCHEVGNSVKIPDGSLADSNAGFLRAAKDGNLQAVLDYLKGNIDINTSNANGLNALHLASKEGHVDIVTELLKRGANVNAATKKGNTALHIASLAGQEEVVQVLVNLGANVNVQSQNGFTPLYMAAQENHDTVVSFLLANGANQSLATEDGFTPLAVALQQGHDRVVAVLLENDTKGRVRLPALHIAAKKDDCKAATLLLQSDYNPDVTSKSGFTPLHIAAHYGNERIANILLDKGADVNYAAKHQITPLHVASKWGKSNMVTLLIEKGAKIDAVTRDGLTPLHCAARSGHDQVVDLLLEKGAPILAKTKNGLAPLHMASQGDHVDSARILLYHKAPVDDVTVDYLTALHVAAHCGHVKVAKLLLDRKADPNARALNGFTPLHIACKKNRIKVVELLLKNGASIEATTESGLSPLHVASFMGCMNIVIHLIQNGANPDVPTVRGETPLHLAARANQIDIIRILLRNGANVDARAREDQTPLHIAARLGNVDIVSLLLQHGAAVDATTKDMYTALHVAAKEGQEEVASVLIDHNASLTAGTKRGFTPLHLAAKYGNIKVVKLLLQKDAPVDAQGKNGLTPLHVAAHYNHVNEALLVLEKGASPHACAKNGYTPLHIAAKKNQMDIATALLEYGANCNAESKAGYTPLHLSSQEGHTEMTALLIENHADVNSKANNGLTPLHLCAQEDRVDVASVLVKNGAKVHLQTNAGYTPLHVACHFGQINMVRFLLQRQADVHVTNEHGYTPLHQAAQQGHVSVVNLLLDHKASPNATTVQGHTPLSIAQRLGYISVVETLKVVTETVVTTTTTTVTEEKYKVVSPEMMQETFLTDSEDEGGEDTMLGDQSYRYLTADEMKSLGDDSLPIDVTKDEKQHDVIHGSKNASAPMVEEDKLSPQHIIPNEVNFSEKFSPDNIDISHAPVHAGSFCFNDECYSSPPEGMLRSRFLVSFMVDARGGAMRGCRHSGVRVIIPPRKASMPMRITCRYLRKEKLAHPPPLMEGEACASRILEVGPVGARFLGPVIIEVPHFASLRGREREVTILRSDTGETWREHSLEASEEAVQEVLNESFEGDEFSALEDLNTNRITRILTTDFPQYFAIITRIRQEVHTVGPEGGKVSSTVVPQVQAVFPEGALQKKIKVCLQAQPIAPELVARLLGNRVAVSPIVTVEPRRRKFHKEITLTIPVPQAASKGMINQYSSDAPTLRLLCSITGSTKSAGSSKAQWEDVTGSTSLTIVNDCVSFTTTVSARFWLMDCRQVNEVTRFATELYQEAIHVPFMAKFVVFAKRYDPNEAQIRVFCMSDDKEDKTLETQEHFTEIAKSRDVEVLEDKLQYLEFAGNLVPVMNSGEQLKFSFHAFHENRLPFTIRVKDPHAEAMGRIAFMREPKVGRGELPQTPICNLNIALPEVYTEESQTDLYEFITLERQVTAQDAEYSMSEGKYRVDLHLSDIARELDKDWMVLAHELGVPQSDVSAAKVKHPNSMAEQGLTMLRTWFKKFGNTAAGHELQKGLQKIQRQDVIQKCTGITLDAECTETVEQESLNQSDIGKRSEENVLQKISDSKTHETKGDLDVVCEEKDIMKEPESFAETSSGSGSLCERDQAVEIYSDGIECMQFSKEITLTKENEDTITDVSGSMETSLLRNEIDEHNSNRVVVKDAESVIAEHQNNSAESIIQVDASLKLANGSSSCVLTSPVCISMSSDKLETKRSNSCLETERSMITINSEDVSRERCEDEDRKSVFTECGVLQETGSIDVHGVITDDVVLESEPNQSLYTRSSIHVLSSSCRDAENDFMFSKCDVLKGDGVDVSNKDGESEHISHVEMQGNTYASSIVEPKVDVPSPLSVHQDFLTTNDENSKENVQGCSQFNVCSASEEKDVCFPETSFLVCDEKHNTSGDYVLHDSGSEITHVADVSVHMVKCTEKHRHADNYLDHQKILNEKEADVGGSGCDPKTTAKLGSYESAEYQYPEEVHVHQNTGKALLEGVDNPTVYEVDTSLQDSDWCSSRSDVQVGDRRVSKTPPPSPVDMVERDDISREESENLNKELWAESAVLKEVTSVLMRSATNTTQEEHDSVSKVTEPVISSCELVNEQLAITTTSTAGIDDDKTASDKSAVESGRLGKGIRPIEFHGDIHLKTRMESKTAFEARLVSSGKLMKCAVAAPEKILQELPLSPVREVVETEQAESSTSPCRCFTDAQKPNLLISTRKGFRKRKTLSPTCNQKENIECSKVDRGLSPIVVLTAGPSGCFVEKSDIFVQTYDAPTMLEPESPFSHVHDGVTKLSPDDYRNMKNVSLPLEHEKLSLHRDVESKDLQRKHEPNEQVNEIICSLEAENLYGMHPLTTRPELHSSVEGYVHKVSPEVTTDENSDKVERSGSLVSECMLDTGIGTESPVTTDTASSPFHHDFSSPVSLVSVSVPPLSKESISTQTMQIDTVSAHTSPIDTSLSLHDSLLSYEAPGNGFRSDSFDDFTKTLESSCSEKSVFDENECSLSELKTSSAACNFKEFLKEHTDEDQSILQMQSVGALDTGLVVLGEMSEHTVVSKELRQGCKEPSMCFHQSVKLSGLQHQSAEQKSDARPSEKQVHRSAVDVVKVGEYASKSTVKAESWEEEQDANKCAVHPHSGDLSRLPEHTGITEPELSGFQLDSSVSEAIGVKLTKWDLDSSTLQSSVRLGKSYQEPGDVDRSKYDASARGAFSRNGDKKNSAFHVCCGLHPTEPCSCGSAESSKDMQLSGGMAANDIVHGPGSETLFDEAGVNNVTVQHDTYPLLSTERSDGLILVSEATVITDKRISELPVERESSVTSKKFVPLLKQCADDLKTEEWTEIDDSGTMTHYIQKTTHMTLSVGPKAEEASNEEEPLPNTYSDEGLCSSHAVAQEIHGVDSMAEGAACEEEKEMPSQTNTLLVDKTAGVSNLNEVDKDIEYLEYERNKDMPEKEALYEISADNECSASQKDKTEVQNLAASSAEFADIQTSKTFDAEKVVTNKPVLTSLEEKTLHGPFEVSNTGEEHEFSDDSVVSTQTNVICEVSEAGSNTVAQCIVPYSVQQNICESATERDTTVLCKQENVQCETGNIQEVSVGGDMSSLVSAAPTTAIQEHDSLKDSTKFGDVENEFSTPSADIFNSKCSEIPSSISETCDYRPRPEPILAVRVPHDDGKFVLSDGSIQKVDGSEIPKCVTSVQSTTKENSCTNEGGPSITSEPSLSPLAFDNSAFVGADFIDASEMSADGRSRSPYEVLRSESDHSHQLVSPERSDVPSNTIQEESRPLPKQRGLLCHIPSEISEEDLVETEISSQSKEDLPVSNNEQESGMNSAQHPELHDKTERFYDTEHLKQKHEKLKSGHVGDTCSLNAANGESSFSSDVIQEISVKTFLKETPLAELSGISSAVYNQVLKSKPTFSKDVCSPEACSSEHDATGPSCRAISHETHDDIQPCYTGREEKEYTLIYKQERTSDGSVAKTVTSSTSKLSPEEYYAVPQNIASESGQNCRVLSDNVTVKFQAADLEIQHEIKETEKPRIDRPLMQYDTSSTLIQDESSFHESGEFLKTPRLDSNSELSTTDWTSEYALTGDHADYCEAAAAVVEHFSDEDFEIIDESEIETLMPSGGLETEGRLRKMGSYKDITTVHLTHAFDASCQDAEDSYPSILPDTEATGGNSGFIYGMQFERDLEDQSEEAMDIDSDQYSEEKEVNYSYGMRFEREHELEGDDDDMPCYGDLYTHQEEDEEAVEEIEKTRIPVAGKADFDILAGRKFFAKGGELDDVSVSSLQEFERLEEEIRSGRRSSIGSVDSFNGKQCVSKSGEHDDVSMNSLTEFEKLERECLEAERADAAIKEANTRLSEIEEGQESLTSETSQDTLSDAGKEHVDKYEGFDIRYNELASVSKQSACGEAEENSFSQCQEHSVFPVFSKAESLLESGPNSLESCVKEDHLQSTRDPEVCTEVNGSELKFSLSEQEVNMYAATESEAEKLKYSPCCGSQNEYSTFGATASRNAARADDLDQDSLRDDKSMKPDSLLDDDYQDSLHDDKSGDIDSLQEEIRDSLHEKRHADEDSLHEMDVLPDESSLSLESSLAAIVDVSHDSLSEKIDVYPATTEHDADTDSLKGVNASTTLVSTTLTYCFETTDVQMKKNGELMVSSTDSLEHSSSAVTHSNYQLENESLSPSITSGQISEDYTMVSSTDTSEPETFSCAFGSSSSSIHAVTKETRQTFYVDSEGNIPAESFRKLVGSGNCIPEISQANETGKSHDHNFEAHSYIGKYKPSSDKGATSKLSTAGNEFCHELATDGGKGKMTGSWTQFSSVSGDGHSDHENSKICRTATAVHTSAYTVSLTSSNGDDTAACYNLHTQTEGTNVVRRMPVSSETFQKETIDEDGNVVFVSHKSVVPSCTEPSEHLKDLKEYLAEKSISTSQFFQVNTDSVVITEQHIAFSPGQRSGASDHGISSEEIQQTSISAFHEHTTARTESDSFEPIDMPSEKIESAASISEPEVTSCISNEQEQA